jgi:hypothetical protein
MAGGAFQAADAHRRPALPAEVFPSIAQQAFHAFQHRLRAGVEGQDHAEHLARPDSEPHTSQCEHGEEHHGGQAEYSFRPGQGGAG